MARQIMGVKLRPAAHEAAPAETVTLRFPELFEEHGSYVWTTLRRLGVQHRDLEDLTHDVFMNVFRQLAQYDPRRPIKPWLFGFAFRIASKYRRRRPHQLEVVELVEAVDAGPSPIEQLLARELHELAWAALDRLELDRRAVFILHEIDGCSIPEVAEGLGVPLATAYSRLRLAREDFSKVARRLRSRER